MTYLIVVIIAVLLFVGFLMLTAYEARRGSRLFAGARYRLDTKVSKMFFVFEHVDWGAFSAHLTRTTATTLAHDIAHGTLVAVRAAERFLTRAVRSLRTRRDTAATLPAPASPATVIDTVEVKPNDTVVAPIVEKVPEERAVERVVEATEIKEVKEVRRKGGKVAVPHAVIAEERVQAPVPPEGAPPVAPKPVRRAPRSMDIPRRTKSKVRDTLHESGNVPDTDTPV